MRSLFLLVLATASAASLYVALTATLADTRSMAARWKIMQWQKSKFLPKAAVIGAVGKELQTALAGAPGNPQLNESLGYVFRTRAAAVQGIPELEQGMWKEAAAYYRAALARRPMSPYGWANVALALHRTGADPSAIWEAYDRAFRYGQREKGVQLMLATLGFERWEEAGGERREALAVLVRTALPHARKDLLAIAARHGKQDLFADAQP